MQKRILKCTARVLCMRSAAVSVFADRHFSVLHCFGKRCGRARCFCIFFYTNLSYTVQYKAWYLDEQCLTPVGDLHMVDAETGKLTPVLANLQPQPKTNIFYAKFMPMFGTLTITRSNAADESSGTQTFIYRIASVSDPSFTLSVTLTGDNSVTIHNLPAGEYKVEQQNSWSWRYSNDNATVTVTGGEEAALVSFSKQASSDQWLSGNSDAIRNRKKKG